MKIFIVQYDCLDYYCDTDHIYDVYISRELAQLAIDTMDETRKKLGYQYTIAEHEVCE